MERLAEARPPPPRRGRGRTLRPGPRTPLWNALVRQVRPHLRRRGSKSQLARLLGTDRHRLHVCLTSGRACLDAERALLLLAWVGARESGRDVVN